MNGFEALLAQLVLTLYYLVLAILAVYGSHRLLLVALYYQTRGQEPPPAAAPRIWPKVTVQLPLYNEMYVASRLLDAVCRLDYPRQLLEIQVLDDSTDETSRVVAERVAFHQEQGIDIQHLQRSDRKGYKAGALEAGLALAKGEMIAIFDADFVPPPTFLRRTIPHLVADGTLAMVQARWSHINRGYSLLTRIQAILLDGHFIVEHAARNRSGRFFNFNGTAGVWRRRAIASSGGWQHDTLTEDLDLSYRAQLAGWRFLLLSDLDAPAELPVDINAFKSQQFRWAKGSVQTAKKLLRRILRSPLPLAVKTEAFVHLSNNVSYPLMVLLSLLVFPAMLLRRGPEWRQLIYLDLPLFLAATVSVLVFYAVSQLEGGKARRGEIRFLPALMGLGIGLATSNSQAVFQGLRQQGGVFERTPKYRIEERADRWQTKRYRVRRDLSFYLEGLLAIYFLLVFLSAVRLHMWPSLPFLYLFLQGYWYMFLLSLSGRKRRKTASAESPLGMQAATDQNAAP